MFWGWVKTFMPRGLYGRAALILLVPIVSIQLVVSVVFIQRHFNRVTLQMTGAVVLELSYLRAQVNAAPDIAAAQQAIAALEEPLAMRAELPGSWPPGDRKLLSDFTGGLVTRTVRAGVEGITAVDLIERDGRVVLALDTLHGPMRVSFSRTRLSANNPHQLLVLMVVTAALMTLIAYLFLRNQLRPIARLARAAEAFGKGQVLPYRLAGATEVRAAGHAFLDMRARIERQIEQRTLMLSGVSHDLRTPLTRLKLGLSMLEAEPERDELERDVTDMERLVDEFLNFARSNALEDEPELTDPLALVHHLVENAARSGQDVELGVLEVEGAETMRPVPVTRALENLLANAARYGTRARLSVYTDPRHLRFVVEDDGPGIAAQDRDEALKPFSRLDAARNQDKGSGVGLGLAIANDIARTHGGHLLLGQSDDLKGLMVEFILPR